MNVAKEEIRSIQDDLGYVFKDEGLLFLALTHTTFAYESGDKSLQNNERLEFLGDSLLGMFVAEFLYERHPEFMPGELTTRRAELVNRNYLAQKAKEVNLSKYLFLGKGEEKNGGRDNLTNLACVFEAIIGAIYLDGGVEAARRFILEKVL